jgi:pimeloyl-ACP methyl ester carboxylesterase
VWWYRFARAPGCQRSLGVPDERDAQNRIEDYVDGYLPAGITRLLELTGCDEVSLLGYCFGGDLALLHAAHHPYSPLRSLTVMAAPVDLRHMGPLADVFGVGGLDVTDRLTVRGDRVHLADVRCVFTDKEVAYLKQQPVGRLAIRLSGRPRPGWPGASRADHARKLYAPGDMAAAHRDGLARARR